MADIPLMDFDQFQMHTERIKDFLNKKDWYYKNGDSIFGGEGSNRIYIDNTSGIYVGGGAGNDYITVTGGADRCTVANGSTKLKAFTDNTSGNFYSVIGDNGTFIFLTDKK